MTDKTLRDLGGRPSREVPVKKGRNVVAVIGINKYLHNQTLHNAVSDARGIRDLFTSQLDYTEVTPALFDEQATGEAMTSMVRDELSNKLEEDDSLVFFFAGHGYTETRKAGTREVKIGYLIPVDGRKPDERKFASFVKIASFLEDIANLPARHVLVILDACDSGFALGDAMSTFRGTERYKEEMSSRMSRRVISSALDQQPALDNGPLPGHSLFTGTLIEALSLGKADEERKGFVTGTELGLYLQQSVATHSSSKQTPDFGSFELDDRGDLVISLLGETHNRLLAMESLQAGKHGLVLGSFTNDPRRYAFAASQFRQALKHAHLSRLDLPEAEVNLGKALFLAGETEEALKVLVDYLLRREREKLPEAYFLAGICQAKLKQDRLAIENFRYWLDLHPANRDAGWIHQYIDWLSAREEKKTGTFHVLLIGINDYQANTLYPLQGCVNDVKVLMLPLLEQKFHLQKANCQLLVDQFATRRRISNAFDKIKKKAGYSDTVLVYFSGHSIPTDDPLYEGWNDVDTYLLVHDSTEKAGRYLQDFSPADLHRMMKSIPAVNKTLILDTHASRIMIDLAEREGGYNLVMASDTAESAYEWKVTVEHQVYQCGMLSGALYLSLQAKDDLKPITYRQWINQAIQTTQAITKEKVYPKMQTPLFVGEGSQAVFGGIDPFLSAFEFTQRSTWKELSIPQLTRLCQLLCNLYQVDSPDIYIGFGKAFRLKGAFQQAENILLQGLTHYPDHHQEFARELAYVEGFLGKPDSALIHWQDYAIIAPQNQQEWLQTIINRLENFDGNKPGIMVFLLSTSQEELEAQAPEGEFPEFDEAVQGRYSWGIGQLKRVLTRQFGEHGFDLQIFSKELILTEKNRIIEQYFELSEKTPMLICFFGSTERNTAWKTLPEISLEGKPIFVWAQNDPHIPLSAPR